MNGAWNKYWLWTEYSQVLINMTIGDYGSEQVVETILDEPLIQKMEDNNLVISEAIPTLPTT